MRKSLFLAAALAPLCVSPVLAATIGATTTTPVATSTAELSAAESRYKDTPILDYINKVQTDTVTAALAGTEYAALPVLSIAAPFSRSAVFPARCLHDGLQGVGRLAIC